MLLRNLGCQGIHASVTVSQGPIIISVIKILILPISPNYLKNVFNVKLINLHFSVYVYISVLIHDAAYLLYITLQKFVLYVF